MPMDNPNDDKRRRHGARQIVTDIIPDGGGAR